MSDVSENTPRVIRANTVEHLIVVGLGYCCEWFFWERYWETNPNLVAARLGVEVDTIRRHRAKFADEQYACQNCPSCLTNVLAQRRENQNGN